MAEQRGLSRGLLRQFDRVTDLYAFHAQLPTQLLNISVFMAMTTKLGACELAFGT